MPVPKVGEPAPAFSLDDQDGKTVSLESLRGKTVVLYFYPRDDTPGCTKEACDFRDSFPRFSGSKAVILGVSPDTVKSHAKFRDKFKLPFTLLADTEREVAHAYGVWRKKKFLGREYMGVVRTTFVIDKKGIVRNVFEVKRVPGHVDAVQAAIGALS